MRLWDLERERNVELEGDVAAHVENAHGCQSAIRDGHATTRGAPSARTPTVASMQTSMPCPIVSLLGAKVVNSFNYHLNKGPKKILRYLVVIPQNIIYVVSPQQ